MAGVETQLARYDPASRCYSSSVDRPLEDLLRAIIGSDAHADLDDKQRENVMYAFLGVLSKQQSEAIWKFTDSISDEFVRSHLLHKFVQKIPWAYSKLAKRVADSIPIAYWRYSAVIHLASEMLKWAGAGPTNFRLRNEALEFIREAETNIPFVDEDDQSTIVWEAGLLLVKAGELDWAEKLAECNTYCPENTEVLLRVAKARAEKGEKDHALQVAHRVADMAAADGEEELTPRAFDVLEVAEFIAELGEAADSRHHLDTALRLAIDGDARGDSDAYKCIRAVALHFAKMGDIAAAREAASYIKFPERRNDTLQKISEASANL
jgi:hypothetical protein